MKYEQKEFLRKSSLIPLLCELSHLDQSNSLCEH